MVYCCSYLNSIYSKFTHYVYSQAISILMYQYVLDCQLSQ